MQDTGKLQFSRRKWLGAIVGTALVIALAASCSSLRYGDVLKHVMAIPFLFAGVFVFAFLSIVLGLAAHLVGRWRKKDREPPEPGMWSFVWVSFQFACLLALLAVGAAALVAIPLGYSRHLLQAFVLVLVISAMLFIAGGAVRNLIRVIRRLR